MDSADIWWENVEACQGCYVAALLRQYQWICDGKYVCKSIKWCNSCSQDVQWIYPNVDQGPLCFVLWQPTHCSSSFIWISPIDIHDFSFGLQFIPSASLYIQKNLITESIIFIWCFKEEGISIWSCLTNKHFLFRKVLSPEQKLKDILVQNYLNLNKIMFTIVLTVSILSYAVYHFYTIIDGNEKITEDTDVTVLIPFALKVLVIFETVVQFVPFLHSFALRHGGITMFKHQYLVITKL